MADVKAALDGARYILMERFAEDAALLAKVRDYLWKNAHLVSKVVEGKEEEGAKFRDYFDHHEPISQVPSHRALAMFRGRNEGVLQLALNADPQFEEAPRESRAELIIINHLNLRLNNAPADARRKAVVNWTRASRCFCTGNRADGHGARARGRRSDQRVRPQHARSADGGAGRHASHHGPRSACAPG